MTSSLGRRVWVPHRTDAHSTLAHCVSISAWSNPRRTSMRVGQMRETGPVAPFRDDAARIVETGRAMCMALDEGSAVVSIADGTHRRLIEEQLATRGVDIIRALATGRYVSLDARAALSTIIDGSVDVIRFAEVIGAPIDLAAEQHGRVLVFGGSEPLLALESLLRSFIAARPLFVDCR